MMKTMMKNMLIAMCVITICHVSLYAGEKKVKNDACKKQLKGVVHLSDNDVRFKTAKGMVIFVDPVNGPESDGVVKSGFDKPDLILITHPHGDHFQPDVIKAYLKLNPKAELAGPADVVEQAKASGISNIKSVKPGKSFTMRGIDIETVPACFLEGDSHPQASNWVGYVLNINDGRYYVTGDTQPLPGMEKIKADVIFPLLYGCGGNLDAALKMTKLSGAKLAVPVHYGNQVETVKKFIVGLPEGVQGVYFENSLLMASK